LEYGKIVSERNYASLAVQFYEKAARIKPNNWHTFYSYYNLGMYSEANEEYDRCLRIGRDNPSAWDNKGKAHNNLGEFGQSIKCYKSDRNRCERTI
jgi:tetratricopeptide (TPR) repeat protein